MSVYLAEVLGTMLLIILGSGVNANNSLKKTFAQGTGWVLIASGWAFAVCIPAFIFGDISGAHFNPALTIAMAVTGAMEWSLVPGYIVCQMVGAILGATLVFLMFYPHWAQEEDQETKRSVFCTGPAIKNTFFNVFSEALATFVLVFSIMGFGEAGIPAGSSTFAVAGLIYACGASLGGTTGYAINPARDLGPRIAHAILPIPGKGSSNWDYAWVPVIGPIIGGLVAAALYMAIY